MTRAEGTVPVLRIARHCRDPFALAAAYVAALGFSEQGRFSEHDGFDGVMVGWPGVRWHLEFVAGPHARAHPPETEDALVLYYPNPEHWRGACDAVLSAGFVRVAADNPWWEEHGASFADSEGFRLILVQCSWPG